MSYGYLAVGEAAGQNNPFTGGGILEALKAADIASDVIAEAIGSGDTGARKLAPYRSMWMRSAGKANSRFGRAASVFYSLSDDDMESLLRSLSRERAAVALRCRSLVGTEKRAGAGPSLRSDGETGAACDRCLR